MQREVGQQRAGAPRRRRLEAGVLEAQAAGEAQLDHGATLAAGALGRNPRAAFALRERSASGGRPIIAAMTRDLRLLAGAAGLSALGDFLALLPLVIHVQQHDGSPFAVAGLFLALWGPVVVGAGLAGALVDRVENRALLAATSFVQAGAVAAIALSADSLAALLPLAAVLGCGVAVSQPAEFALVPAAAGAEDRVARANGALETARSLGFTLGPLAGGALGAAGLLGVALAVNAASFAVVGLAALALRARRHPAPAPASPATAPDPSAATPVRALLADRQLAIALGGAVAALALFTMSQTAEPFFVTGVLHAGSLGYGVLITTWTLGMAAGAAGLGHRAGPRALAVGALAAVVVQGVGIAAAGAATTLAVALAGCAIGGAAHGAKNTMLRTLIHESAPEAARGRAFAAYNGARNAAELGALLLGGALVGLAGARATMLAAGIGPALVGLAALALLLSAHRSARPTNTTTIERSAAHARIQG
jgi:MFS family permease